METVVQIAAVCLAAAILGAVLRQHSPETAAVLGPVSYTHLTLPTILLV